MARDLLFSLFVSRIDANTAQLKRVYMARKIFDLQGLHGQSLAPHNSQRRSNALSGFFASLIFLISGCFQNTEAPTDPPPVTAPGMRSIRSAGQSLQLGSDAELSNPSERPAVTVTFSYNFSIDTTEVTQSSFQAMTGWRPVGPQSKFGAGDAFPVYNVSWFDAVLYCNSKSKSAGMDTVYEYQKVGRNDAGGAYQMDGLTAHLDRLGFRLPTEAEWEFAAHAGSGGVFPWGGLADSASADQFSWYDRNSSGTTHPVAGKKPNAFELYDMTGNVMEWVNDWKGAHPSQPTRDFAGARDPGLEYDRPVKGGAFKFGLSELRPANRTTTYPTIPSAVSEYVGFRCALGRIPHASFSSTNGQVSPTDAAILTIPDFSSLVAHRPAKLVFINAMPTLRRLAYVDYSQSPAKIQEFTDRDDVFHPSISPDGNWVAFCTRLEGVEAGSDIYLRPLDGGVEPAKKIASGFIPRWWVNPQTSDTFLVYTTSAIDNSNSRWNASQTLSQKISAGKTVGPPTTLTAQGGFHDGYSGDGRYLATGFRLLKMRDTQSDSTRVLFTAPANGKEPGDTSQVCNVSMAPDSSGRTLFLDFGTAAINRLTGTAYGPHQYAFIADPKGKVLKWIPQPQQESGLEDLEWSNAVSYAVTGGADAGGGRHRIYLLNLDASTYTTLLSGTELLQPGLWLGPLPSPLDSTQLDRDSVGQYNAPANSSTQEIFANKMHTFWTSFDHIEAAFLGSSQMALGLDPWAIKSVRAFNLSYPRGDLLGAEIMARSYLLPNCPNLKLVAFNIPIGWLNFPGNDFTWTNELLKNKGILYDQNHDFWKSGRPAGFLDLVQSVPYPAHEIDSLGLFTPPGTGWGGPTLDDWPGPEWDTTDPAYQSNFARFEKLVADLSARGIKVLFIIFPQSPVYASMHGYCIHGPSWPTSRDILAQLQSLESKYPNYHFLDFNLDGHHDYVDSEAFDSMHLSHAGATKLSARLDIELRKILTP